VGPSPPRPITDIVSGFVPLIKEEGKYYGKAQPERNNYFIIIITINLAIITK
jgi:hypothetical protein